MGESSAAWTVVPRFTMGQRVHLTPDWQGQGAHISGPWYISAIQTSALDTGEVWHFYTLASAPKEEPRREKIPYIRDDQLTPWLEEGPSHTEGGHA